MTVQETTSSTKGTWPTRRDLLRVGALTLGGLTLGDVLLDDRQPVSGLL